MWSAIQPCRVPSHHVEGQGHRHAGPQGQHDGPAAGPFAEERRRRQRRSTVVGEHVVVVAHDGGAASDAGADLPGRA